MHIVLFEDHLTGDNRPLTLPRAAFAVSLAATNLYAVAKSHATGVSAVTRKYLKAKTEASLDLSPIPAGPVLFINGSLAPAFELVARLVKLAGRGGNFLIENRDRVAAAYFESAPAGAADQDASTISAFLVGHQRANMHEELPLISMPHDVVKCHQKYFGDNIKRLTAGRTEVSPGIFAGRDVKIHPTTVFDTSEGPIIFDDGVTVGPFAYFIGPVIVGRNTKIIERASIKEQVQIGNNCKIGGEVECSSIEAYTNKQHHGFLGHAYVGSWVNMGAGTSNSDLKNTYGEIAILHLGEKVNTGMQFLGCIIGDFSKTAINTSIFTGKIVGVSSYLYGFVGTNVPSFTNYARSFGQETECLLDAAVKTQARMFARRKVEQSPLDVKLLDDIYDITRDERLMSTDQLSF
jgi:glucose-1-phosphate thymidylyltransferase